MARVFLIVPLLCAAWPLAAQEPAAVRLPAPDSQPLSIDFAQDPVLSLIREDFDAAAFRALIEQAVARDLALDEGEAGIDEAAAVRREARTAALPTVALGVRSDHALARSFDDDNDAINERARPRSRTDVTVRIEQTLFDFGATGARIAAAGARLRAAGWQAEALADDAVLRALSAWYDVYSYRALEALTLSQLDQQRDLRADLDARIGQGVSAAGDRPRIDGAIAEGEASLAQYRRALAAAEARFVQIFGTAPPARFTRAPAPVTAIDAEDAARLARGSPAVARSEALARAARQDARASRAEALPRVTTGIDAGKYGLSDRDYDVRANAAINYRTGGDDRADQADARARAADSRAQLTRTDAEREAMIAVSDVAALEAQLDALTRSYAASRQSRDVLVERFRVARGSLFDVLEAQRSYVAVAVSLIRAAAELDGARYVLLARTGRLRTAMGIAVTEPGL